MATPSTKQKTRFPRAPLALAISSAVMLMTQSVMAAEGEVELDQIKVVDSSEKSYTTKGLANPKYTQELVDTPKTISIINEAVLEDQGVTSLEDALRNVSGVSTFGAGEGGGNVNTSDNVTIRGFDANDSIYTDGIRDISGYSRDTFNTEQIEIVKGANGSISGKGSAGGSINLVTKAANLRGDKNSISTSYDESNMSRFTGDFNKVLSEDSAIRVNIMGQKGGDYWDNGEEDYESKAFAISYFNKLTEKADLTINFESLKQDNTPVIGLPYISAEAAAATGLSEGPLNEKYWSNYYGVEGLDFEEVDKLSLTTIFNYQINDSWSFRNQTRFSKAETKSILSRPYDNGDGTYSSDHSKINFSESKLFVSQFDFMADLGTDSVRNQIVLGAEFYQESQKTPDVTVTYSDSSDYDPTDPSTNNISGSYTTDGYSKDATSRGLAAYASDTISLGDHWQLMGGLRLEKYTLDSDQDITSHGRYVDTASTNSDSTLVSWNLGANYKPTKNGTIYISYANNEEPNGSNLSLNGSSVAQVEEYINLDPLESTTAEIGTKWNFFNNRLLLTAALFNTTTDTYDDDDDDLIFGEEESTGIELSATGQFTDTLSVIASYTHQHAKVTKINDSDYEGDGLSSAPEDSASIWFAYSGQKLGLGIGAEYTSGIDYWRHGEAYFSTGEVILYNAMASYKFTDQLSAQLNIANLTNETYVTDYSAKGHFLAGYGRNAKATLRYDF